MLQFQLERYLLDATVVIANPTYDKKQPEQSLHIETQIGVANKDNAPDRFMLVLSVAVGPDKDKPQQAPPYNVNISGRAFFAFKDSPKKEEVEKFLNLHGAAILYGMFRGQVAQITALGVHGQMLMPTLNFVEMLKQATVTHPIIGGTPPTVNTPPPAAT